MYVASVPLAELGANVGGTVVVVVVGPTLPLCPLRIVVEVVVWGLREWAPAMARPVTRMMTATAAAIGAPSLRGRWLIRAIEVSRLRRR